MASVNMNDEFPSQSNKVRNMYNDNDILTIEKKQKERMHAISDEPIAKTKKRSKFKEAWFGGKVTDVKDYLIYDVMIPALKATVEDFFGQGLHMALYGEAKKSSSKSNRIAYGAPFRSSSRIVDRDEHNKVSYDDILFIDERKAIMALKELIARADEYDCATVLDLYDVAGITGGNYMDDNYGWTLRDLRSATIKTVYDRRETYYMIDLPRPMRVV